MGEIKAEMRKQDAKVSELKAKNRRLKKEVERLETARSTRKDNRRRSGNGNHDPIGNPSRGNSGVDSVNGRTINVEATFYTAFCDTGCNGVTFTGDDVRNTIYSDDGYRIIAVDPTQIKLGSIVRVTLANGDTFKAKASDTGGAIKGARIDVLVSDRATARKLGRQAATVEVLSK